MLNVACWGVRCTSSSGNPAKVSYPEASAECSRWRHTQGDGFCAGAPVSADRSEMLNPDKLGSETATPGDIGFVDGHCLGWSAEKMKPGVAGRKRIRPIQQTVKVLGCRDESVVVVAFGGSALA